MVLISFGTKKISGRAVVDALEKALYQLQDANGFKIKIDSRYVNYYEPKSPGIATKEESRILRARKPLTFWSELYISAEIRDDWEYNIVEITAGKAFRKRLFAAPLAALASFPTAIYLPEPLRYVPIVLASLGVGAAFAMSMIYSLADGQFAQLPIEHPTFKKIKNMLYKELGI